MKTQLLKCFVLLCISTSSSSIERTKISHNSNGPYESFCKKHVIDTMGVNDCSDEIRRRGISTNGSCKPLNTFIVDSKTEVKKVCHGGGKPVKGNLRKSVRKFEQVVCKLSQGKWPNCKYAGFNCTSYVVLACDNFLPVHFERYCKQFKSREWFCIKLSDDQIGMLSKYASADTFFSTFLRPQTCGMKAVFKRKMWL